MPGNPLYRRPHVLGVRHSPLRHTVHQERAELTSAASQVSPLLSPAKSSCFFWPVTNGKGRSEIVFGPGSSISRERPVLIAGLFLKTVVDISLSAIALLLLWPFLLLIAFAIKLESPGSIIYASARAGKNGRTFSCYIFRTMFDRADELKDSLPQFNERQDPFFKIADDPRVTRLGRFLRKYGLIELPQFWNVLKGDINLVGPRPHPVDDYSRYRAEDHRRLDVKPGITGLWQVMARANPCFETCMTLDLEYMRNWNLLLDLKILMRTVPRVLSGDGR